MELLSDPIKDRQVKSLKSPPHKPLDKALMWPEKLKSYNKYDFKKKKNKFEKNFIFYFYF